MIRGPDGYEVVSAVPEASAQSGPEATWEAGSRLDGFEVVFAADGSAGDGALSRSLPGFGAPAALLAVVVSTLSVLAARRRS